MNAMRIEGPRSTDNVRKSDKARKGGGASGSSFSSFLGDGAEEATATGGSSMAAGIGGLLSVQGAEDPAERKAKKRMMERASDVLDSLDGVHRGLVTGQLNVGHLRDVEAAMARAREKITDPALIGLLDEVDLRAQVEIAKLEMARDKNKQ